MLRLAFDFIITWRETRTRPNAYKHYNICGLWGVSMALGRFNKRAAFTTFFRNFRLFS